MVRKKRLGKRLFAVLLAVTACVGTMQTGEVQIVMADEHNDMSGDAVTMDSFNAAGMFEGEDDLSKYVLSEVPDTNQIKEATGDEAEKYGNIYDFWSGSGLTYTMTQTVHLEAGRYKLTADAMGNGGMKVYVYFDGATGDDCVEDPGWNVWETAGEDSAFNVTDEKNVNVGIYIDLKAGAWGDVDNIKLEKLSDDSDDGSGDGSDDGSGDAPSEDYNPVDAGIKVEKINNLPDDFIEGVDVSSYLSEKNSGVNYYDFEGNKLDDQGFFNLLKDCGVNYVRIRVWVDPYDEEGNGYGGGNNDLETAKQIGKWASAAGMKVLIDFHYSDFWTDPGKQYEPKSWAGLSVEEKAQKIEEYTVSSLAELIDAGVDVGMVQVGNETNAKFCGETEWENICTLFKAGCNGVREIAKDKLGEINDGEKILIALHFADPQNGNYSNYAKQLKNYDVDYDIFASSYYPFFHGSTDNLTKVLKKVAETYDKKVMVAETSWATTLADGDGHDNQIRKGNNDTAHYDFSVYGQATEVRTVMNAVKNVGNSGIGAFYWEPAWIPVNVYDKDADNAEDVLQANKEAWEKYGSGWAASYAGDYQIDAKNWWGGSAMDNQAMFDFTGHPLESLKVFNYIKTGTNVTEPAIASVNVDDVTTYTGKEIETPKAVVVYTDGTQKECDVLWNNDEIAEAKRCGIGTYKINGTIDSDLETSFELTILAADYFENGSIEEADESWILGSGTSRKSENARTGAYAFNFWKEEAFSTSVEKTVTLDKGSYQFGTFIQGGDVGEDAIFKFSVSIDGKEIASDASAVLKGWNTWINEQVKDIEITKDGTEVTVKAQADNIAAGGWGSWDDFYINKMCYSVKFADEDKTVERIVESGDNAAAPDWKKDGYTLSWDKEFTNVSKDMVVNAIWNKDESEKEDTTVKGDESKKEDTTVKGDESKKEDTTVKGDESKKEDTTVKGDESKKEDTTVKGDESKKEDTTVKTDESKKEDTTVKEDESKKEDTTVKTDKSKKEDAIVKDDENKKEGVKVKTIESNSGITISDVNGILPASVKLLTEKVTDKKVMETVKNLVQNKINGVKDVVVYELNLSDGTTELHQLDGKVQVTMDVPFAITENETIKVFRVDGEKLIACSSSIKDNKLVFETDHFSTYAFVKVDKTQSSKISSVKAGDNSMTYIWAIMIAAGACIAMCSKKEKRS